jgi:hypothetical protein
MSSSYGNHLAYFHAEVSTFRSPVKLESFTPPSPFDLELYHFSSSKRMELVKVLAALQPVGFAGIHQNRYA